MKPKSSTHHRLLLQLQRRIYGALEQEVDRLLGEPPPAIKKYEREFRSDFHGRSRRLITAKKEQVLQAIRGADVTFVADFHAFRQAQRTALRLMREVIAGSEYKWFIGVELIPSHHQYDLDAFQEGRLDLDTFHRRIRYAESWGFPWKNYAPIFDWAREKRVRLIALNRPKEIFHNSATLRQVVDDRELRERDLWAAGLITDLFADERRAGHKPKMIVLYGELHLARRHIPGDLVRVSRAYIGKPLRNVIIHQTNDEVYWQLARQQKEHRTDVVKIGKNIFCVLSSTPWAKLQSLVSWAESETAYEEDAEDMDPDSDFSDESMNDTETDYLSLIQLYGAGIAGFLGITKLPSYEALTIQTINEADFVSSLKSVAKGGHFTHRELKIIRHHVSSNQRIYIPRADIAYLGSPSENGAAELAAIHLLHAKTRTLDIFNAEIDDFYRQVLEATFGFFGSLIINPKRKCDLPADHARRLRSLSRKKRGNRTEIEARRLTLEALVAEKKFLTGKHRPVIWTRALTRMMTTPGLEPAVTMAARFLGQILGKRLHRCILDEEITREQVRYLFLARMDGAHRLFEERYLELLKALGLEPVAQSKSATL